MYKVRAMGKVSGLNHAVLLLLMAGVTVSGSKHQLWRVKPGSIQIPCPPLQQAISLQKIVRYVVWKVGRVEKGGEIPWKQLFGMNGKWKILRLNGTDKEIYELYACGILKVNKVTSADNGTEFLCDVRTWTEATKTLHVESLHMILFVEPRDAAGSSTTETNQEQSTLGSDAFSQGPTSGSNRSSQGTNKRSFPRDKNETGSPDTWKITAMIFIVISAVLLLLLALAVILLLKTRLGCCFNRDSGLSVTFNAQSDKCYIVKERQ